MHWHRWDRRATFLAEVSQGVREARCRAVRTSENNSKLADLVLVMYWCVIMTNLEPSVSGLWPLMSKLWLLIYGGSQAVPSVLCRRLNNEELCKVEASDCCYKVSCFLLTVLY